MDPRSIVVTLMDGTTISWWPGKETPYALTALEEFLGPLGRVEPHDWIINDGRARQVAGISYNRYTNSWNVKFTEGDTGDYHDSWDDDDRAVYPNVVRLKVMVAL